MWRLPNAVWTATTQMRMRLLDISTTIYIGLETSLGVFHSKYWPFGNKNSDNFHNRDFQL